MKMNSKKIYVILIIFVLSLGAIFTFVFSKNVSNSKNSSKIDSVSSTADQNISKEDNLIGTPNPAAVYCAELGYGSRVVEEPRGQRGICIFSDGSECDEWDFFKGECGKKWSYCAKHDYNLIIKTDGKNGFTPIYAVCIDKDGNEIGSVDKLMNLSEKLKSGCEK